MELPALREGGAYGLDGNILMHRLLCQNCLVDFSKYSLTSHHLSQVARRICALFAPLCSNQGLLLLLRSLSAARSFGNDARWR